MESSRSRSWRHVHVPAGSYALLYLEVMPTSTKTTQLLLHLQGRLWRQLSLPTYMLTHGCAFIFSSHGCLGLGINKCCISSAQVDSPLPTVRNIDEVVSSSWTSFSVIIHQAAGLCQSLYISHKSLFELWFSAI